MTSLARKHRPTAARLAAMHGQACVPVHLKNMHLLYSENKHCCMIKANLAPLNLIGRVDAAT